MTDLTVSVVIVSRGRPEMLKRCLLGVSQQQFVSFEIVVVADHDGAAVARQTPFGNDLKVVDFDTPNISAARNLGLTHAAGEIVAFIDDDAVPEPDWLHHLTAPAAQTEVAAMGGFVRARNGISFQWTAQSLNALGEPEPLEVDQALPTVLYPPKGSAIKTEGTNMAFRRSVLIDLGGFDPAFHYFLDETDLNMRLAHAGHATVIVPLAEVHHGFAANATRSRTRVPRDLFNIGASWAVFQRKHLDAADRPRQWQGVRHGQRNRLLSHMMSGALEPRDVRRLLKRLDAGYEAGQTRPFCPADLPAHPVQPFQSFPASARHPIWMKTRPIRLKRDLEKAALMVMEGHIVTLLCLSLSSFFHHLKFTENGVWLQKGGLFGRSERSEPLFHFTIRSKRLEKERSRIEVLRGLGKD